MKRILASIVLLTMALAVAGAQENARPSPKKASSDVVPTITKLEDQWAKAGKAADAAGVGALLADDWVIVDSDGTTYGKSEEMARVKKVKFETVAASEMKVIPHGNTAIASGVWTVKGTDSKGKFIDTKERFIDTWVKMTDGKWLCVASGSATMK